MIKTALHSVSYAGVWPGQICLCLDDFLVKARDLGFDAVMLMAKRPHVSLLDYDDAFRRCLREKLAKWNLSLACLAGYTDFCMGADRPGIPAQEMQILYVHELCRLAHDLGCGLVRVFTGFERDGVSLEHQWALCVDSLRACARYAAPLGVTIGVQNHHDVAVHWQSLLDLLRDINEPNCKAMFDAWAPALQGDDPAEAVKEMAPFLVHTTVADYVRRPRFRYQPALVNYDRQDDAIRAVPMGEGFIDYRAFFRALREIDYQGYVAYEMCSPLRGGGSQENLDRCARQFLRYMAEC